MNNIDMEEMLQDQAILLEDLINTLETSRLINVDDIIDDLRQMLNNINEMLGFGGDE